MCDIIYLDNAATTFPKPLEVYDFMDRFYRENGVNAGRGSYKKAREATELIDDTRKRLANLINSNLYENVIFTPSATIALNQILNGLEWELIKTVYITPFEHNAVMRTLNYIKKQHNIEIIIMPFDNISFELDKEKLNILFSTKKPDLLVMSHISNVTGYILPINNILKLVEKFSAITILDASQSLGLVEFDITKTKVDFLVFAGHKTLYGPFGIAGYYYFYKKNIKHHITGGTGSDSTNLNMPNELPYSFEAGSYNIQAISGLNASLKWIEKIGIHNIFNYKKKLTNLLLNSLSEIYNLEVYIPKNADNHIGIVSFNVEKIDAEDIGKILDEEFNICIRTGHHCAPLIGEFLGENAKNSIARISLSYFNTVNEILILKEALENIVEEL